MYVCFGPKKNRQKPQVFVEKYLCGTIKYEEGVNPYIIECGSHKGREITVVGGYADGILTFCEVEVYSATPPGTQ